MDMLFGEQQEQTNSHDRVKFKAQEISLNPCFQENRNSTVIKPDENYYFFQLNDMCEFYEFNEKPETVAAEKNESETPV